MSKDVYKSYEILGLKFLSTQKELITAYRKLALIHHPDKGGSEEKFREIKEAYEYLLPIVPRVKFEFSNKPGSDKFEEFREMLKELNRQHDEIGKGLAEDQENINKNWEKLRKYAIESTEEKFSLFGVSPQDLDASLWSPYSDWKEKFRNSIDEGLPNFLNQMASAIEEAGWKKKISKFSTKKIWWKWGKNQ